MHKELSLDNLWNTVVPGRRIFSADDLDGRPLAVRRYLAHAIADGTPLASAVRLRMHGEIKLKRWHPFVAEQVICASGEMIWRATVRLYGMPVRGSDRIVAGAGSMQWKLFNFFSIFNAAGTDITRSTAGRVGTERIWLPSALAGDDLDWGAADASHARTSLLIAGEKVPLALTIGGSGRVGKVTSMRWGNPDGAGFRHASFGGWIDHEARFGGYTIPTRLRIGWNLNADHFDAGGEFFRVTVDDAQFR